MGLESALLGSRLLVGSSLLGGSLLGFQRTTGRRLYFLNVFLYFFYYLNGGFLNGLGSFLNLFYNRLLSLLGSTLLLGSALGLGGNLFSSLLYFSSLFNLNGLSSLFYNHRGILFSAVFLVVAGGIAGAGYQHSTSYDGRYGPKT